MEKKYLKIGYIVSTHGLKGGLKIKPATTFIDERFHVGKSVLVKLDNDEIKSLTIKSIHENKGLLTLNFKEITTIEEAETLLKRPLLIDRDQSKLEDGYFYLDDLLFMHVYLENGTLVGEVSEILEYAAYYTLRVKRENDKDLLIPYVDEFIVDTQLEEKKIIFRPIEGML